jgi:predicted peroxiredoxin
MIGGYGAYGAVMTDRLVVKATSGADAPERCAQAFTVASVASASGVSVSLWLTGEASWFGVAGRAEAFELPHSAPLHELRDAVLASGTLTVCTQCAARRSIVDVLPGVRLAGAAVFVSEVMAEGARALVY